jgi:hypothetical protein
MNAARPSSLAAACALSLAMALHCPAANAADVYGTAYTVLLRGHAPPGAVAPRPPAVPGLYAVPQSRPAPARPATAGMRLVLSTTGQELASASYDSRLGGYLFRLPMSAAVRGPVCLVLKGPTGASLPVRDARGGDDGFAFRNIAWEAEAGRVGELTELRGELASLNARIEQERTELARLQADSGGVMQPQDCTLGPVEPDPPRPAAALSVEDASRAAGGICALAWERAAGAAAASFGRLFADAGLAADWTGRESVRPAADGLTGLRLSFDDREGRLISTAASRGSAYLEHADGVRAFVRVQNACRQDVLRLAAAQVQAWQSAVDLARQAPQRAKARCEQRATRVQALLATQGKAAPFRTELERRIAHLAATPPAAADSARIDHVACRES